MMVYLRGEKKTFLCPLRWFSLSPWLSGVKDIYLNVKENTSLKTIINAYAKL